MDGRFVFAIVTLIVAPASACGQGGGGVAADEAADVAADGAADVAAEAIAEGVSDPAPDLAPDPTLDPAPDPEPETAPDPGPDLAPDVPPPPDCCTYDWQCGTGWRCVPVPGEFQGACLPAQPAGMCWTGSDCGPGKVCVGAIPCPCDWNGEGDGCDIPGTCVEDTGACCDTDFDCPAAFVCGPGALCVPEAAPGRCWFEWDCYGTQTCEGVSLNCGCGDLCNDDGADLPGTCTPLPHGCCNSGSDCSKSHVCKGAGGRDHMPGRCVPWPGGPACPEGEACCWTDDDCTGGWCKDAYFCGCIDLCYACGACADDQIGRCVPYGVEVDLSVKSAACDASGAHPAFTSYRVTVAWHTSIPAKTSVTFALNQFSGQQGWIPSYEFVQDGEQEIALTHMHLGTAAKPGDKVLIRATSEGAGGEKGVSGTLEIIVDEAIADCIFPYDDECSDGGPVLCRAVPPPCDGDKVMAAIDGCQRCVHPSTCSCDDGTTPTCLVDAPVCDETEVLAVQQGCWACVSRFTCKPAVPGAHTGHA